MQRQRHGVVTSLGVLQELLVESLGRMLELAFVPVQGISLAAPSSGPVRACHSPADFFCLGTWVDDALLVLLEVVGVHRKLLEPVVMQTRSSVAMVVWVVVFSLLVCGSCC
jgi:hypothetical protein